MKELLQEYPIFFSILQILYVVGVLALAVKIIMDTRRTSKTLAYLLLVVFLPIVGVIVYFVFGVNYRKTRFFSFKIKYNQEVYDDIRQKIRAAHDKALADRPDIQEKFRSTVDFLARATQSPLINGNHVQLLQNGEEKFPKVFEVLSNAKHHIHLEYYIYEADDIGKQLAELLMQKAKEGVTVRFLYDDFGSSGMRKKLRKRLEEAGVHVSPVNKVRFKLFANRINYRDHRKIIVVDGQHAFTGGINVADKYINPNDSRYWRDVHLYIRGAGAFYFQYLFLTGWMFATKKMLKPENGFFFSGEPDAAGKTIQVAASGPDTTPAIMMTTVSAIYSAKKRILLATPYFIPTEPVMNAIKQQSLAGVEIFLLAPERGDSAVVNAAAFSYFEDLLSWNVRIWLYQKGMMHAKTMVVDDDFACVGTANLDIRSHELNFEVNTLIYDKEISEQLAESFMADLQESREIKLHEWQQRPKLKIVFENLARLLSPLM
ncbi:MAG: cardiolipin synthase [Chryseobacterium sp.]|nr:MAG: cardiolipin synthase [Chryseobacterium sp.]